MKNFQQKYENTPGFDQYLYLKSVHTKHFKVKIINEEYKYGFHDNNKNVETFDKGLSYDVVNRISEIKSEPEWMRSRRLEALEIFNQKKMPTWGGNMDGIDFNNIIYYVKPSDKQEQDWSDVPDEIRNTYDKLGIPEAEKKYLASGQRISV